MDTRTKADPERENADLRALEEANAALRASEERYRALVELSPDAVFVDRDGRIVLANRAAVKLLGAATPDQILGRSPLDLFHPDDYGPMRERTLRLSAGEPVPCVEARIVRMDGTLRDVAVSAVTLPTGDGVAIQAILRDITESKRSEAALRASEEKYRMLFSSMDEGFILIEVMLDESDGLVDMVCVEANAAATRMLGQDFTGKRVSEISLDYLKQGAQAFAEIVRTGQSLRMEQYSTITRRWYDAHAFRVGGPGSRLVGAIFQDITERKRADDALRVSEGRYRELVQNANSAILRWSRDGGIVFFNEYAQRLFGYSAGEILGKPVSILVPEVDSAGVDQAGLTDDILANPDRYTTHVNENIRSDGSRVWMAWTNRPVCDEHGQVVEIFAVGSDVTERKQAEDALRASEERFRLVTESMFEGLMLFDIEGSVIYQNPASLRIHGIMPDAEGPMTVAQMREIWDGRDEADRSLSHEEWPIPRVTRGEFVRDQIIRVRRTDTGAVFWASYNGSPIYDDQGMFTLGFVTIHDITERKRAEQALQEANEQLREADRRKNDYIAMLSHELRNPLAAVSAGVGLARMRGSEDPKLKRAMEVASRQVSIMARMLDGLLDVARITRGQIELHQERVDIADVVQTGIETALPKIEARRHQISVSLPPEPLLIDGDSVRLAQVVSNILDNAAKYTPDGGQITIAAAREGGEAVLRVRDTGKGISPEFLPHVFETFARGEHSTGSTEGGIGLGLALVRLLVEMHGGRVEAHSEGLGKGSEFVVHLPIPEDLRGRGSASGIKGIPRQTASSGKRVLVVDDNEDTAELLAMTLELDGHEIVIAHDGPAALEAASRERPDVVLLDLGLPGIDGYEVARRLRQMPGLADVPLVAVTGYGQEEDRQRTASAGFACHLLKPVGPDTLRQALAEVLASNGVSYESAPQGPHHP